MFTDIYNLVEATKDSYLTLTSQFNDVTDFFAVYLSLIDYGHVHLHLKGKIIQLFLRSTVFTCRQFLKFEQ